jgi:hypothetical protein
MADLSKSTPYGKLLRHGLIMRYFILSSTEVMNNETRTAITK